MSISIGSTTRPYPLQDSYARGVIAAVAVVVCPVDIAGVITNVIVDVNIVFNGLS